MTKTDYKEPAPSGVKLEVTALIDRDLWAELSAQGYTENDFNEAIKKSITFNKIGKKFRIPLFDILEVELLKYY